MTKYIKNKKIENNKANEVLDLNSIGEAAWKFISAIYNSGWDSFIADKNNNSFRQKVLLKFTSKLNPVNTSNKGEKKADKPASFKKLSSPILAKLPKEVNEILKFFKKNNPTSEKKDTKKLYTQALSSSINTSEVFKIKETFPNLQTKKIENIQKIINNEGKPKLRINMMTKSLSYKQIIIPMSNNNKIKFIEESNAHITNINRALKNIKSGVMADFV